jgi:MFS family permease
MDKIRSHSSRYTLRLMEAGFTLVFLGAVAHHVLSLDFKPLAAFCLPILVVLYGFASLLFTRGRALPAGRPQARSLYAAERAMQAAVWYLFGIILGVTIYGLLSHFGMPGDASEPWQPWFLLLAFLAPYAFMQVGLICFLRAVWVVAPYFLRPVDTFEFARRVHQR